MSVITSELFSRWEFYVALVCIYLVSRVIRWFMDPLRSAPGPWGLPIIGNTLDYRSENDVHATLLKRAQDYGPLSSEYTLFTGRRLCIADPECAKHVLVTNSSKYDRGDALERFMPALGNSLLTSNGKAHAFQRKLLNPAFSMESVKDFLPIFNQKGNELIKFWEDKIEESNGKPFKSEIQTKFTHLTLDVIGLCGFGYSFDGIKKGNTEESQATNTILTANFNMMRRTLEFMFPFLEYIPSKERDGLKRAEKVLYGLMEQVIDSRLKEMKESPNQTSARNDLLQRLINMYEAADEGISNKGLFHQIFTFMLAGHETTSLTLTWILYLLAKHPEIQSRVRKEVKDVLGNSDDVALEDLDKLKFLDDCIKESMRLYPVAPFTGRKSRAEDKIGPYVIPAGTSVVVLIGALNRNEKLWENASQFNPDRFKQRREGDPLFPYSFLPFSRGPRMCIGYRFAQMEIKVVLAQLINSFSFKIAADHPHVRGKLLLTLNPCPSPVFEISKA